VVRTGDGTDGVGATVAYFEHLLEFGLATSTVAGVEEGIVVQTPAAESYEPEQQVRVTAPAERVYLFDVESGERLR
jgi:multiple sugar transport system ATP-binding protein